MEKLEAKEVCKKHMYRYVRATMSDGSVHDGFIEHVDEEKVYLAVPIGHENMPYHHGYASPYADCWDPCYRVPEQEARAFFPYFPYGYGFGYPFYGYPYGRRFRRLALPLFALTALSLLPFY
ncbi:MAG TPA: hypothetical protein VNM49_09600 [Paenibacillus cookii]|uniref:hypothetical protein n=1 Tax=Paenibacillus cookii TaxID=157839 RepID=UPI0005440568|nr:hypothetical protein [Paenibacillus cookii]KHF33971.1 hypothetical protein CM49_03791 [Paenibacillus sp. P1XP2]HWO54635.1 hypothetical protein [Paenibacillus cookii]